MLPVEPFPGAREKEEGAVPRIVVFVGPSFPPALVHELVPSAELRPPVRRGDMATVDPPAIVAIIDGVFDSELAVAPREIRNAIARGVRVLGASSMGALRAAEVPEMIGVGRIYEMYRNGSIQRDDEVAVLLDADSGKALTEPLANIRFAVDTLVRSGTLDPTKGERIVETASKLHFHDRVYRNILRNAGLAELEDVEQLISALRAIDLKREDAHTLLERLFELGSDPTRIPAHIASERPYEYADHFASVRIPEATMVDATLMVWELGERIQWADLAAFLVATGKLDAHARRVLAREQLDEPGQPASSAERPLASVQELFSLISRVWGWKTAEEVHVTLNDLGIGFRDLRAHLRNERGTRRRLRALWALRDERFMRALKHELLTADLSLKRETMRLGALQVLARAGTNGDGDVTDSELEEAKHALLCEQPELTWDGLLDELGVHDAEVRPIVELVASARRFGIGLLAAMENAPNVAGEPGWELDSWPGALRIEGCLSRSVPDGESAAVARKLGRIIGVTRVAQLGELERFGLHVTAAYRPSEWSSTVGSGKSESLDGAIAGALMEEVEKYCQERFEPDIVAHATFTQLDSERSVDPLQCALPFDSTYTAGSEIAWSEMFDLLSPERIMVPAALLTMRRTRNDVFYSARRARKVFSTNGLAAGFTTTEALVHALCERIERHAVKLAEQAVSNPGGLGGPRRWPFRFVDLETCPSSTRRILSAIRGAGYAVRVMDITCEVTVPTFSARIFRTRGAHGLDERYCSGSCAHANPEIAVNRALLEAVQTRVASLSGAREDFGVKARSLGRHERPRPLSRGDAYWIRPHVPKESFSTVRGLVARSAREDLDFIVRRLTAAGFDRVLYRDLSRDETTPAYVVRAFVPGMEDTNPFHTGLRARTLLVQDLMRHHEW